MDLSGLLSPKANAFSIAHLIDASQLPEFMNINSRQTHAPIMFNWDSFRLTKDMEGERVDISARTSQTSDITPWFSFHCLERLRNAGTGKKVSTPENSPTIDNDTTRSDHDFTRRVDERCSTSSTPPTSPLSCSLANVKVDIEMKNLWDDFFALGTEMIVTKAGRLVINFHFSHLILGRGRSLHK